MAEPADKNAVLHKEDIEKSEDFQYVTSASMFRLTATLSRNRGRTLNRQATLKDAPAQGKWYTFALLNITGTMQPPFLSLPYAIAGLGFAGGLTVLFLSGAAALYCTILLALLHHHDGIRHSKYRDMSRHILGPTKFYSGAVVYVFQYLVNFGVGVCNIILSAQLAGSIFALFCGSPDVCDTMTNTRWTLVVGGICLFIAQIPDLAALEVAIILGFFFTIIYTVVALVLSFQQADAILGGPVSYSLTGTTATQAFNALNALGIIAFAYGNTIAPEMQATLQVDSETNTSTRPMVKGTLASFSVILSLYSLVSIIGYYKFGNAAPGFLLQAFNHPAGLVAMAQGMCIFQELASMHIYVFPLYEAVESKLLKRYSKERPWMKKVLTHDDGTKWVRPSLPVTLMVRTPFIVIFTFIAAALPFFTSIMGLLGAVGLTPLTFVLPAALYLEANGHRLSKGHRCWLWLFITGFTVFGVGAAIGALRSIIVSASTFDFFT